MSMCQGWKRWPLLKPTWSTCGGCTRRHQPNHLLPVAFIQDQLLPQAILHQQSLGSTSLRLQEDQSRSSTRLHLQDFLEVLVVLVVLLVLWIQQVCPGKLLHHCQGRAAASNLTYILVVLLLLVVLLSLAQLALAVLAVQTL